MTTGSRHQAAMIAVVGLGSGLRLAHYLYDRALWRDEASLWKSIALLPWSQLTGPLYNDEESPLGFLALEKLLFRTLGDSGLALRSLSLLASLAGLVLFVRLARRVLEPTLALLAVAVFAVAYSPVYYAAELKPYSLDLAIATALLLVAAKGLDEDRAQRTAVILGVAGAVSIWFSFQSIFVLAGAAATFWLRGWVTRDRRWFWAGLLPGIVWVFSLGGFFLTSLSRILSNKPMEAAWVQHFWPVLPRDLEQALWLPRHLYLLFRAPADLPVLAALVAVPVFFIGIWSLWRARDLRLGLLLVPILLPLVPSAIRAYPYHGRHLLFALPGLLLLLSAGIGTISRLSLPGARQAAWVLGVGLSAASVGMTVTRFPERLHRDDVRPLMARLADDVRDGTLYVYHGARKSFEYYSRRYPLERRRPTIVGARDPRDVARLDGAGKVWVLVIRVADERLDNWPAFAEKLAAIGVCSLHDRVVAADRTIEDAIGLYQCQL